MRLSPILAIALATAACSGGHGDDHPEEYDCVKETRDDEFVMGLTKTGGAGQLSFKLVSSDPAPPSRGDNTWILELSTMAAPVMPVSGATMSVTPFMPDHEHGSGEDVIVTPMPAAGQYKLEPVNLWMPGLWEVTMQVNGAQTDRVVFKFCLPS
jgi:hypothetical protein